jgi:hypothetical protein
MLAFKGAGSHDECTAHAQRQTYVAIKERNMNILTRLRAKRPFKAANMLGAPWSKPRVSDAHLWGI